MADNTQQVESILELKVDYQSAMKEIAAYIAEIKHLNEQQKDLNKAFAAGTISDKAYGEAMAKNKAVSTQLKGEMKALSTEVKKQLEAERAVTKQIDINNASYNKLAATYKSMKQRINEMTQAERQQNKQFIDDSKKVYERMKTLQAETGKMQLNVGNYQSAITGLVTGNSKFAASLLTMSSGAKGLTGVFGMLGNAAKAFGQALMTLAANPVFLAIMGVAGVGMAFKFWKDYNDGLAEATRLTKQFTDQSGDALNAIRDSVQATADTYGKDFKETLQGVDTLVAQYGISWKEANDIINKGFAAGADINEDFLQQIQQYGPALKDAGLSAEELVAVIQQTRSGIFGKDGLDVIQKAGKNLRDMSENTAKALQGVGINADEMKTKLADGSITMMEAIQQVSGALKTVGGNTQEAGAIISDVFGKKGVAAGQEQLKAIEDLNLSLDSLIESEGEYGKVQQEMVDVQAELNAYTAALFGMDGWDVMKKKAELLVKKGLLQIVKWTVKVINYFIDWYNESLLLRAGVNAVIAVFKTGWEVIKLVFNLVIDAVKQVGRTLKGLGDIVEGVFTLNWDKISGGWDTIINGFSNTWKEMSVDAKNAGANIGNAWADSLENTVNGRLDHIEVNLDAADVGGSASDIVTGGGSSSSTPKKSGKGKSGNTKADRAAEKAAKEAEAQRKKEQKAIDDFTKQTLKMMDERTKSEVAAAQKRYELLLAVTEKGSQEELELRKEQLNIQERQEIDAIQKNVKDVMEGQRLILLTMQKFNQQREALDAEYEQKRHEAMLAAAQNEFAIRMQGARNDEIEQLRIQLEQIQYMKEQARQKEGESAEAFAARMIQLDNEEYEKKKDIAAKEIALQQAKAQALGQITGAIGDMFESLGEKNRDALIIAKVLAIAEIAIQQGIAIANAIRAAAEGSHSIVSLVAQIAVGIATVTASIVQAVQSVKSAKFAKGGLITGPGTGTSDSIHAQVSNGESVMTASATALFSPLLSALNQLGGGVPIMGGGASAHLGEDMLAAAIAKGYALAPAPVVSVREITDVENRVKVIEQMATS